MPSFTWTDSRKLITPEDGATWSGKMREVVEVIVSEAAVTVQRARQTWTASFRCFEPREVTLSGCTHQAGTVEAEFAGKGGRRSQPWVYFPTLGLVGGQTRQDGVSNGLAAPEPVQARRSGRLRLEFGVCPP